jgi:hypothetical protein
METCLSEGEKSAEKYSGLSSASEQQSDPQSNTNSHKRTIKQLKQTLNIWSVHLGNVLVKIHVGLDNIPFSFGLPQIKAQPDYPSNNEFSHRVE